MASFPFSGLKKQLNKANQFMTERITGVEGTKLDNDFQEMERRTGDDVMMQSRDNVCSNVTIHMYICDEVK
jgi:hypothetical protein